MHTKLQPHQKCISDSCPPLLSPFTPKGITRILMISPFAVTIGTEMIGLIDNKINGPGRTMASISLRDLNNLNKMLGMKEELVSKMKASDHNMQAIKEEYEVYSLLNLQM